MRSKSNMALQLVMIFLPFSIRRRILNILGHNIHREARVGFSIIIVDHMELGSKARVGHLNFISGLKSLTLQEGALLGNLNWITARMTTTHSSAARSLSLHEGAAITNRHYIDCNGSVVLRRFSTFAGVRSQIFTHSIDLREGKQGVRNVLIGEHSFVGTASVLLPGATVPHKSIVAAGSVVRPGLRVDICGLYTGNPAVLEKEIDATKYKYMTRSDPEVRL